MSDWAGWSVILILRLCSLRICKKQKMTQGRLYYHFVVDGHILDLWLLTVISENGMWQMDKIKATIKKRQNVAIHHEPVVKSALGHFLFFTNSERTQSKN